MKRNKIIGFFVFGCTLIYGQSTNSYTANILPPTPETFNFSVQNTNFTNTPSGDFTYNLPLHEININNFSLPISLNYRSGVKIDDLGSNVGTSWQLNAGGVVSRVVRDMPDELAPKRWLPSNLTFSSTEIEDIKEAALPGMYVDTEYDWFNFNVSNGFSGNFYLDQNLNPIYAGDDYIIKKIEHTMLDGKLYFEFIITDKLGNKYFFGGQKKYVEETTIMTSNNSGNNDPNPKPQSATGWFLHKIITSSGKDILLDYDTDFYSFFSSVDSSLNVDQECACNGGNGLQYKTSIIDSKTLSSVTGNRLKSISSDKETILFIYNKDRDDVTGSISSLLTAVELKNKNNLLVRNFVLTYDDFIKPISNYYFTESNQNTRYRYFLKQVQELYSKEKHLFEYYNPYDLPARFSLSADYYGYYNKKNNNRPFPVINDFNSNEIRTIIPIIKNKIPTTYISADKEVNPTSVHFGNLRKITYPTGGTSTIIYEPNKTMEQLPVENFSSLNFMLNRQCEDPKIIEQKKTITSNGGDIFLDAIAAVDYWNCGEPDDLHEVYGMSVKDLSTGIVIWSKNKKVSEGGFTTDISSCFQGVSDYCPIKTEAGRSYEITFRVSSKIGEISGTLDVKYNKVTTFEDKNVFYAGSRVQRIIEDNNEGSSYSKNYFYNSYDEKNSQKSKISFYVKPVFYYIKSGVKNCYFDCGCYNLPIGPDRTLCMGGVDQGSGAVLESISVGYTTNSLFNSFNNRSNKPFYTTITEEVVGKSLLERVFNEFNDTPALTFVGPEIFNLPYSNTSNLMQGKIKEEHIYEFKNNSYSKIKTNEYAYDFSKDYILKSSVFKQNYPIPPFFLVPQGYIDNISIAEYYNHYGEAKMTQSSKQEFINANTLYSITTNRYTNQNHYQLTSQKTTFPDLTTQETTYQYSHEKGNTFLTGKNMVGIPLETEVKKNGVVISKSETKYPVSQDDADLKTSGLPLPVSVSSLDLQSNAMNMGVLYKKYDSHGNLLQYNLKPDVNGNSGNPVTIIWGYNNTQPIAKIEGIGYDALMAISGISAMITDLQSKSADDVSDATEQILIGALDSFRTNSLLAAYQISTYTYKPLIGVSSITPPSGIREIYKYDTANRLQSVVDVDGNILKEYSYQYKQ